MTQQAFSYSVKYIGLLAFGLFLSGCSLFQKQIDEPVEPGSWAHSKAYLEELENWTLTGKIGFRTAEDGGSAAINQWAQNGEFYRVELSSTFLGLGAVLISGGADFVSIIEEGEEPLMSETPDLLLEAALGFPLPTRYLPLWIKGLTDESAQYEQTFNEDGLPATIKQHGWKVELSKYASVNGVALPKKVVLRRDTVKLTLAIKDWNID